MKGWTAADNQSFNSLALQQIRQAPWIAAASDRGAINHLPERYGQTQDQPLQVSHLFSGATQTLEISEAQRMAIVERIQRSLTTIELTDPTDKNTKKPIGQLEDRQKLAWWLWRCLPIAVSQALNSEEDKRGNQLLLLPAEAQLPDASVWSYSSITAALASSLTGYDRSIEDLCSCNEIKALPKVSIATFSFTPVQELIKASRKMRDFWSGSWVLHYLSAKIAWEIALKYGPDTLLYPSLFQQPLIDHWLLQSRTTEDFEPWITQPSNEQLLTAGFPNVLVFVLPENKVRAAMQMAKQTLQKEWLSLGKEVLDQLHAHWWMRQLKQEHKTWKGWLEAQWQTYWSSVCLGDRERPLVDPINYQNKTDDQPSPWCEQQNQVCQLETTTDSKPPDINQPLFTVAESKFLRKAAQLTHDAEIPAVNIGSWWPYTFAQTRRSLMAVKSARPWTLPTAFSNRSTISGIGPAVHPDHWKSIEEGSKQGTDWIPEGTLQTLWRDPAGTFDGREQLNATEVLKRGLQKILPDLLFPKSESDQDQADKIRASSDAKTQEFKVFYPDLTAGVVGYLKTYADQKHCQHYQNCCQAIRHALEQENGELILRNNWGIPWADNPDEPILSELKERYQFHPRHLNAGWLAEEVTTSEIKKLEAYIKDKTSDENIKRYGLELQSKWEQLVDIRRHWRDKVFKPIIAQHYPEGSSPADWYVLAAGDGDGMSNWLKGKNLRPYEAYMPKQVSTNFRSDTEFKGFLDQTKRMGPATHSALSRALLDFSNQLLPYLTEERYAGRLIYGGGDDVLAYSNLWEWDQWLRDVRECFRGAKDPQKLFKTEGDYWQWNPEKGKRPDRVSARPLFTMGSNATISFGVVIANQAVPLAIALENLWEAEEEAKKHSFRRSNPTSDVVHKKDAVQVRVLYGNGNILKATAKFNVFNQWRHLIESFSTLEPALFEQAATLLSQHPIPLKDAIDVWCQAFCDRRDIFANNNNSSQKGLFYNALKDFLTMVWDHTGTGRELNAEKQAERDQDMQTWLKLAAFVLRKRKINLGVTQEAAHAVV